MPLDANGGVQSNIPKVAYSWRQIFGSQITNITLSEPSDMTGTLQLHFTALIGNNNKLREVYYTASLKESNGKAIMTDLSFKTKDNGVQSRRIKANADNTPDLLGLKRVLVKEAVGNVLGLTFKSDELIAELTKAQLEIIRSLTLKDVFSLPMR